MRKCGKKLHVVITATNIRRKRARNIMVGVDACKKWKMNTTGSIKGGKHTFIQ
jgi:hypothetical protein